MANDDMVLKAALEKLQKAEEAEYEAWVTYEGAKSERMSANAEYNTMRSEFA